MEISRSRPSAQDQRPQCLRVLVVGTVTKCFDSWRADRSHTVAVRSCGELLNKVKDYTSKQKLGNTGSRENTAYEMMVLWVISCIARPVGSGSRAVANAGDVVSVGSIRDTRRYFVPQPCHMYLYVYL